MIVGFNCVAATGSDTAAGFSRGVTCFYEMKVFFFLKGSVQVSHVSKLRKCFVCLMSVARVYRSSTTKWISRCDDALRSWLTASAKPFPGGNPGLHNQERGQFNQRKHTRVCVPKHRVNFSNTTLTAGFDWLITDRRVLGEDNRGRHSQTKGDWSTPKH